MKGISSYSSLISSTPSFLTVSTLAKPSNPTNNTSNSSSNIMVEKTKSKSHAQKHSSPSTLRSSIKRTLFHYFSSLSALSSSCSSMT